MANLLSNLLDASDALETVAKRCLSTFLCMFASQLYHARMSLIRTFGKDTLEDYFVACFHICTWGQKTGQMTLFPKFWCPKHLGLRGERAWGWGCISLSLPGLGKKCNYCCYVLTPMWIAHLPLACSLQGYHGVIHDNLAGSDWGMAQAGNRAGKTQPCMQMGENGLE